MEVGVFLTALPTLGLISSYWVAMSSHDIRVFALFYCILFCSDWLLFLGGMLFSEEKWRGKVLGGERKC